MFGRNGYVHTYLDLLFLLNLFVDYFFLYFTSKIRNLSWIWYRGLLASFIGATAVCVPFFLGDLPWRAELGVQLTMAIFMICCAFGYVRLRYLIENMLTFCAIALIFAGFIQATHQLMVGDLQVLKWQFFFLFFGLAIVFFTVVYHSIYRAHQINQYLVTINVRLDDVSITCRGLIDTGNQCFDPLTNKPVHFMQLDLWQAHLSAQEYEFLFHATSYTSLVDVAEQAFRWRHRVSLIPYSSMANRSRTYQIGLHCDSLEIFDGQFTYKWTRPLIVLTNQTFSHDRTYQAIIHHAVLSTISSKAERSA
jgi:stage II sporulation protein GA (sporulation sigma-E factor processing peptidase)